MRGEAPPGDSPVAPVIDAIDWQIIRALQANGREPFRRIAGRVGVSEATVRARYARLTSENVLHVAGVTNPLTLGFEGMAMVGIRVNGLADPVADEISQWRETSYVVVTAGQFDVLVELMCIDHAHLHEVTNRIRLLPFVASTESFVYLEMYKQLSAAGSPRPASGEGESA